MRESPTKILATGANIAADTEHSVTIGAVNDGKVYHIKAIHLHTLMTVADISAFKISSATDDTIWQSAALTAIGTGANTFQAHRGIAAGFTDGNGAETVILPDKMIVPGGFKVETVAGTIANIDHGQLIIFGSVFKAL